jgi:hypothetical protein
VPAFPRREFGITATKSNLSYGGDVQSTSNTFKGAFSFAHAALGRDVTIANLLETLARPEDYVRGVLENLYACLSQRSGSQKGDLFVRIGVTGNGIVPHYRIDYFSSKGLGNISVCATFGAFDGRTHKKIALLEEASIQRDESILLDQNWSTRSTTFKEIENLLGQIRDIKKKSR